MTAGRDENGPARMRPGSTITQIVAPRIYDWLAGFGVHFEKKVILMPDNTVPRWHKVVGKGRGF
jgi:hypothetical protein